MSCWLPTRSGQCLAEPRLNPIVQAHLPQVAQLHMRAFPGSAITALGSGAVERYYAWLLDGPHDAQLMGAWHEARLVGFCAAGVFRGAMSGFLRANRRYLALRIARRPSLLRLPMFRERLRQGIAITLRFSRLRTATAQQPRPGGPPSFGVLSIATDTRVRGLGIGRALMIAAEERARSMGHARMVLTVHVDNHRAIRFYEELGWRRTLAPDGSWSGGMFKPLD